MGPSCSRPPPPKRVTEMEPQRVLSVSQVNAYLGCSLKYRFQYVDKIPRPWRVAAMAFGSSVHAAVEWFHKERLVGRSPELEWLEAPLLRLGWPLGLASLVASLILVAVVLIINSFFWRRRTA